MEYDKLLLVLMLSRSLSSIPLKEENAILGYCMDIIHVNNAHVIFTLK